ncbi:zinc finger MYM-type protein 1-like [Ipomoea triloba]|uniref:zinc finger MYM-type protein 1-like n=1 Tax=Ipomoea triloba TaxID=35885 RepID=UPI00125D4D3A|nr:zinc finger MYM-type protein 1-like [Ipomoea triloba]
MTQDQHIQVCVSKYSEQSKQDYRVRLTSSVTSIRFLLRQGLAFRGNDETLDSLNWGNFLEFLKVLADTNEDVGKVVMQNAPENHQMTSPLIQKDIVNAIASETTEIIINDLGEELFGIIVDESRDVSLKEQMIVFIRYVNSSGHIVERMLGITHVRDTTSMSLKVAIEDLLTRHGLSISRIRGQGYDGASNMRGKFNGLKTLIINENPCAFYVHCFAHQLQLALVGAARENSAVGNFFVTVSQLCNIVCAPCKRKDSLRDKQLKMLIDSISTDTIEIGIGLNQESVIKRLGDTRWGSHYGALVSIVRLFSPVIEVLDEIGVNDGPKQRTEAFGVLEAILCFDFVFFLHLMKDVLGITNDLSQALQKKDQNIVSAIRLLEINQLQTYFVDVTSDPVFSKLGGINELAQKMVETGRHLDYTLVYLLLKLSLILPVATASVERAFSAMKLIKTSLRNRMGDDLLHDCLLPYVKKEVFDQVSNEAILLRFQNMRERRGVLPRSLS